MTRGQRACAWVADRWHASRARERVLQARFIQWARAPRNRGTITLLIVAIPFFALLGAVHVVDQNARHRSERNLRFALGVQCQENADTATALGGLSTAVNSFSQILGSQFALAQQRATASAADPHASAAVRAKAKTAIEFYELVTRALPHAPPAPLPTPCVTTPPKESK